MRRLTDTGQANHQGRQYKKRELVKVIQTDLERELRARSQLIQLIHIYLNVNTTEVDENATRDLHESISCRVEI